MRHQAFAALTYLQKRLHSEASVPELGAVGSLRSTKVRRNIQSFDDRFDESLNFSEQQYFEICDFSLFHLTCIFMPSNPILEE